MLRIALALIAMCAAAQAQVVSRDPPNVVGSFAGVEQISNTCNNPATTCTATCSAGKKVLGGGCNFAGSLPASDSFPASASSWFCQVAVAPVTSMTTYALCSGIQ